MTTAPLPFPSDDPLEEAVAGIERVAAMVFEKMPDIDRDRTRKAYAAASAKSHAEHAVRDLSPFRGLPEHDHDRVPVPVRLAWYQTIDALAARVRSHYDLPKNP